MCLRPRSASRPFRFTDFFAALVLIAVIFGAGWFFHIREHNTARVVAAPIAASDTGLTWICVSLDGSRSALAIAPGGEGTIRASDHAHAAYEVRMRLCDRPSAMVWTKTSSPATAIFPLGDVSR